MKYLKAYKLFESSFEDLTPYTYGRIKGAVNIGWLDSPDFPKGEVDPQLIDKIKKAKVVEIFKGSHRCPFCGSARSSSNQIIYGKNHTYVFPQMLAHYIEEHKYLPPKEFLEDVSEMRIYENNYISPKLMDRKKPEFIGDVKQNVEIRIDVEAIGHALSRQFRHGVSTSDSGKIESNITKDEILDTIEASVEELTIALMQDQFDIYQKDDDYPTRGVKAGEPNRFVIRNKKTNLNIVCSLEPGEWEFTLTVITVMKKDDFKTYRGQFVLEV